MAIDDVSIRYGFAFVRFAAELAEVEVIQYEQHQPGHVILKIVSKDDLIKGARAAIKKAMAQKTQGAAKLKSAGLKQFPALAEESTRCWSSISTCVGTWVLPTLNAEHP